MKFCENCAYSETRAGLLVCMGQKGMPRVHQHDTCDRWVSTTPEPKAPAPETEVVADRDALPLLVVKSALKVIAELAAKFDLWDGDQCYFRFLVEGVMLLYHEIERRLADGD